MKNLLFLDIETTGLVPEKAELIELSAVRISLQSGEEKDVFDELIWQEKEIPPFIQRLTGISNTMISTAPKFSEVRERFQNFLHPSDIICGHNISFDIGFLQTKGFSLSNKSLDTFPLANILLPGQPSYSLEILTKTLHLQHEDAHRALSDVRANIGLFFALNSAAQSLPKELLEKYKTILQKTEWIGKIVFDEAFSSYEKKRLPSIPSPPCTETEQEEKMSFSESEEKAKEKIQHFLQKKGNALVNIPPEVREQYVAEAVIHQNKNEPMFLAMADSVQRKTPKNFFRFADQKNVLCTSLFQKWLEGKSVLSEGEVRTALKVLREIQKRNSLIYSDLPLFADEWNIAKKWLSEDHTNCTDDCPAKRMRKEALAQKKFFCNVQDIPACPAEKGIVLKSSQLEKYLDHSCRETFSGKILEKWIRGTENTHQQFFEEILFKMGLLKRYIREHVGEGPYRKFFVITNALLRHQEVKNLVDGFAETKKQMRSLFPQEEHIYEQLQKIIQHFSESIEENEYRFITIYPDDQLFFTRSHLSLKPLFSDIFGKKKQNIFMGKAFICHHEKFSLGRELPSPDIQTSIPSTFNFPKKTLFCVPSEGGNTKNSDVSITLKITKNILPLCTQNLLILFPGANLVENFCFGIRENAKKNEFQIISLNGSQGKITQQTKRKKTILVATSANWKKIDFSSIAFSGCVQHRLLFDPPSDPLMQKREENISDEFSEVALPKTIQNTLFLLGGLTAQSHPFFWLCLDSHFQKVKNFTKNILSALPSNLPVQKKEICDMEEIVKCFLRENT
jgi:DNA polymerase III epsilon subunit-like protein